MTTLTICRRIQAAEAASRSGTANPSYTSQIVFVAIGKSGPVPRHFYVLLSIGFVHDVSCIRFALFGAGTAKRYVIAQLLKHYPPLKDGLKEAKGLA